MKRFMIIMVVLGVVGFVLTMLLEERVAIVAEAAPAPSQDPAVAFPQFDRVYRTTGRHMKIAGGYQRVELWRFYKDGLAVRSEVTAPKSGTTRAHFVAEEASEEFEAASASKEQRVAGKLEFGAWTRSGTSFRWSTDQVRSGKPMHGFHYEGRIQGDQVVVVVRTKKTKERMNKKTLYLVERAPE